jgi:hypothetical protein
MIIIHSQPQSYVFPIPVFFITVLQRRPKLDGNILKVKEKKINICTLTVVLADRQCVLLPRMVIPHASLQRPAVLFLVVGC